MKKNKKSKWIEIDKLLDEKDKVYEIVIRKRRIKWKRKKL